MNGWKHLGEHIYEFKVSDAFCITLYEREGYAKATGIDVKIGVNDCVDLAQKQDRAREIASTVLFDIANKIHPQNKSALVTVK